MHVYNKIHHISLCCCKYSKSKVYIWLIWNSIKISLRGNENNDLVNGERFIIKCWNGNCECFAAHVAADDDDDDGGWIPSFTSEYLV